MVAQRAKETVQATPIRVWRGFFVGLALAPVLAWSYSSFGIQLLHADNFVLIDRYVFRVATLFVMVVSASYYHQVRDVSETVAVLLTGLWSVWLGLVDILVYWFLGRPVPAELPWLMDAPVGVVAGWLGMTTVTDSFLYAFVLVTFALLILVVAVLSALEDYGL